MKPNIDAIQARAERAEEILYVAYTRELSDAAYDMECLLAYVDELQKAVIYAIEVFDGDGYPMSAERMRLALSGESSG